MYVLGLLLASAPVVTIPQGAALTEAVSARDTALFTQMFDRCEPEKLRAMVTDDVEMYHDRGGVIARDANAFVADHAKSCAAWTAGSWRSRRELESDTLTVDSIPGYGAIEDGWHRFYERKGDGPERLVGRARFTLVWALTADGWKLSRALSYSHRAVN